MTDETLPTTDEAESLELSVEPAAASLRLDAYLSAVVEGWSRSRLQRLIADGDVLVNGRPAKPSQKLKAGDTIDIELAEPPAARFEPENIPLDIVFEDEFLAVVNKPAGMVVHPGAGVSGGTLANAIAFHFGLADEGRPNIDRTTVSGSEPDRVGIVHRLDKDTSGLIVVAKDEKTHEALAEQFRDRSVYKSYIALVHGHIRDTAGKIERPIARDRWHRTKMTVAANGRYALSLWKLRERFEKFTLVDVEIKTGRTHQIRVHLASINHPVVGDATYNEGRDKTIANVDIKKAVEKLGRVFLHSAALAFTHPSTGVRHKFEAPLPAELDDLLNLLRS
ncbi:MAG: RluA family pseudouridine synthase [Pyrinomonadaceae bacterium]|nr:RluA family pseudouridine synthase [Pyrinomonadaceae bacterium]